MFINYSNSYFYYFIYKLINSYAIIVQLLKLFSVEMKAATWQKDSHGLFDYETQLLTVEKYIIM